MKAFARFSRVLSFLCFCLNLAAVNAQEIGFKSTTMQVEFPALASDVLHGPEFLSSIPWPESPSGWLNQQSVAAVLGESLVSQLTWRGPKKVWLTGCRSVDSTIAQQTVDSAIREKLGAQGVQLNHTSLKLKRVPCIEHKIAAIDLHAIQGQLSPVSKVKLLISTDNKNQYVVAADLKIDAVQSAVALTQDVLSDQAISQAHIEMTTLEWGGSHLSKQHFDVVAYDHVYQRALPKGTVLEKSHVKASVAYLASNYAANR